jgi:hypothetical protein
MKASKDDLTKANAKAKAKSKSKAGKKAKVSATIDDDDEKFDDVEDSNDGEVQEPPEDDSEVEY